MQKRRYILLLLFTLCGFAQAEPWFTGPILAQSGKTVDLGHFNFELYGISTTRPAIFNNDGNAIRTPTLYTLQALPLLTYGLTHRIDVQVGVPYLRRHIAGIKGDDKHIGDTSVLLGFQLLRQHPGSFLPNLRLTIQEIFPTGQFAGTTPTDKGAGATGAGSYQNILALNFQQLTQFTEINYLRTRLSLAYIYPHSTNVRGISIFGGDPNTRGVVHPGSSMIADLAGEFTVTQHWVMVMEVFYTKHQASSFTGNRGVIPGHILPMIGSPKGYQFSIAPAIEYNFSKHIGILAGQWIALSGRNTSDFTSTVIALNAFW